MGKTLTDIQAELGDCRRCELCETRTTVVFGVGNPAAEVMFIGEAPGKQEDLGAEPFIGAAGKYLNTLLELAGLKREEIYIANVLKCRPPENRDPLPTEIEVCSPFLREQVRAIAPEILVTLGNFATRFILKTDRGITGLRGQVHITGRFSVLPIFHPAAAIYDRLKMPTMEADFKLLGRLIAKRREERASREEQAERANREGREEQAEREERASVRNGRAVKGAMGGRSEPAAMGVRLLMHSRQIKLRTTSPEQTIFAGQTIGSLLRPRDTLLLSGDLGAGKTQLTKGIATALGVNEAITSPTFNLMYEYYGEGGVVLRHFDLYRLENAADLDDIDYFGLLEDEAICVVEWGDKFSDALPREFLEIRIALLDETTRELTFSASSSRFEQLLDELSRLNDLSVGGGSCPLS